jgi:thioesterase domain-containing protein
MIAREALNLSTPYQAPNGELETLVAGLFGEVFGIQPIGANDDFFDLGGDSLLAETLSLLISDRTKREFPISALIEQASPKLIAASLTEQSAPNSAKAPKEQSARPPIFFVHGRDGFTLPKPAFRQAFAEGQEIHMFELPGIRGGTCHDRIEDIAAAYVAQLVDTYPQGPVLLAAFCMGGLIALEMAAQLEKMERPVKQMVLLDPGLPKRHPLASKFKSKHQSMTERLGVGAVINQLRRMGKRLARGNAAFTSSEQTYKSKLQHKRQRDQARYAGLTLSIDAQAKLRAAYLRYQPQAFPGPVTILSARGRDTRFRDPTDVWSTLLPRREVQLAFEEHSDIGGEVAARMVQSIFDGAIIASASSAQNPEPKELEGT